MLRFLPFLVVSTFAVTPLANGDTAFPYSSLGFSLGQVNLDEDIDVGVDTYSSLQLFAAEGSYQIDGGPFVSLSVSAAAEDESNSDIEISTFTLGGGLPVQLHERADLVFQAGFTSSEAEFCFDEPAGGQLCEDEDDSGLSYGLSARIWAFPGELGRFEINPFVSDSTLDDAETTYGARARVWFTGNHTAALSFETSDDDDTVAVSYRYFWQ